MSKIVSTTMRLARTTPKTVLYQNENPGPNDLRNIYVPKGAFSTTSYPDPVVVTVEAVEDPQD